MLIRFEHVYSSGGLCDLSLDIPISKCTVIDDQAETQSPHILRLLAGLEDVTQGSVTIDGSAFAMYFSQRPLHQVFAYLFDEGVMLSNLSLEENILLPLHRFGKYRSKDETRDQIAGWLERFEMEIDLSLRPAEVNPARLKYLSYIRALLLEPEVLIIDDPYYVLNKKERALMLKVLSGLKQERVMLIASTDDDFTAGFAEHSIHLGENSTDKFRGGAVKA